MANKMTMRRLCRWLAAICLVTALAMLVIGETLLRDRLSRFGFIVFWLTCFAFTSLAMCLALLDAAVTRRRAQEEQRAFFEKTFHDLASRTEVKPGNASEQNRDSG